MKWFRRTLSSAEAPAVLAGVPITPINRSPASLDEHGVQSMIFPEDRVFYADFRPFADIVNSHYAASEMKWRLQENQRVLLSGYDGPVHGRSYDVFYNAFELGMLEIRASAVSLTERYNREQPHVSASIVMRSCRPIDFAEVNEFLCSVADYVSYPGTGLMGEGRDAVRDALLRYLWNSGRAGGPEPDLEVRFMGQALHYIRFATQGGYL